MTASLTGMVKGNVITLDEEFPPLEGQRVRVRLEPLADTDIRLSETEQSQLWQEWVEQGPQGPIEDEGESEFP